MTVGSGLGASVGLASEVTWANWVTPAKWTEFESETVEWKPKRMVGKGLYNGGLVQRNSQRVTTTATVEGDIKTPIYYKGMGLYLGHAMGSSGVAPVQQASTAAYLQTHALANNYGQSLALQIGRPDLAGNIHQYNYNGCKIDKAVLECGVDAYLTGVFTVDGHDYDTTNTYATPTYQTPNPIFSFNQAQFRIGTFGNEVIVEGVRKFILTLTRPIKKDNFYMDGSGRKQQQVLNAFTDIGLEIETDYVSDSAFVALFNADTAQSVIIDFLGGVIAAGTTKAITGVSAASTGGVVTSTAHGFTNGQVVTITGVTGTGMPVPSINGTYVISNVAANTYTIPVNTTGFTYTSGGSATQNYNNQISFAIPNLRWDSEPPKVPGPEILQPKMKLVGLFDDSHTAVTCTHVSTDVSL